MSCVQVSSGKCSDLNLYIFFTFSKPALLEGLEVDQLMWSVIQNPSCTDAEEVQVDSAANMKPLFLKTEGGSTPQDIKPITPSSIKLPSMGAWDLPNSKSPGLYAPPDMNSKSRQVKRRPSLVISLTLTQFSGIVSGQYPLEEGPLSQMCDAVNNLDKSGLDGHGPHTPCTPHTPGLPATPLTPGNGHKSPRSGLNR